MKKTLFILFLLPWLCATAQTVSTSAITLRNCYATESHTVATIGCGSYWWNGVEYTTTTETSKLFTNARGCDSTAYLHLMVEDWTDHITLPSVDVCEADFPYEWKSAKLDKNAEGDKEYTMAGTYTRTFTNEKGCDSVVTLTINSIECGTPGLLSGVFCVNYDKNNPGNNRYVQFSKGNLQFCATQDTHKCADNTIANGTWRFASEQYEVVGNNSGNTAPSNTQSDWIDLFGFATSGYDGYYPYLTSGDANDYYTGDDIVGNKSNYDWGMYNAISKGGNKPEMWRVLTGAEWKCIFEKRPGYADKMAFATVNDVPGFILLPDQWTRPQGITWTRDVNLSKGFKTNEYSAEQWKLMEDNGAVFLPVGGYRSKDLQSRVVVNESTDNGSNSIGAYYWTSDVNQGEPQNMQIVRINNNGSISYSRTPSNQKQRYNASLGMSVRLVMDVK